MAVRFCVGITEDCIVCIVLTAYFLHEQSGPTPSNTMWLTHATYHVLWHINRCSSLLTIILVVVMQAWIAFIYLGRQLATEGIVFCLYVRVCVCACHARWYTKSLWTQYHINHLWEFHQIYAQLRCSWGQRWTAYILQSNWSALTVSTNALLQRRHTDR